MLIIPGGYANFGETPQEALKREFMEETKIEVEAIDIILPMIEDYCRSNSRSNAKSLYM